MTDISDSFSKLIGRQPSDKEVQELYRVRDALGLQNNDALWLIIMALQHYQTQYESIPNGVRSVLKDVSLHARTLADIEMRASAASAQADLAAAVANASDSVARKVAGAQRLKWFSISLCVLAATLGGGAWFVHQKAYIAGASYGFGEGYESAKDERARAAWANTPEGRAAYSLAQTADLKLLASCGNPGWVIRPKENGKLCLPHSDGNMVYGWMVP